MRTRVLVDSGVEAVRLFLAQNESQRIEAGGIFDNADRFRGVTIIPDDDPNDRGMFSVISPNFDSSGNLTGVRNGLEDESTRLNLNVLITLDQALPGTGRQLLMALPGMTEDVADAILDWLDADDEPREFGAEIDYYGGLHPPYSAKNGPVETVEELLLVKGVTPQLLFGADINRNGQLDAHETLDDSTGSTDPSAFRGWSAFLTLYSMEWNVTPERQPRIYLNTNDLNKLNEDLTDAGFPAEWVTFIVAYRQMGPYTDPLGAANSNQQTPSGELNMDWQPQYTLTSFLDLVGTVTQPVKVQYQFQGSNAPVVLTSPFTVETMNTWMSQLLERVTTNLAATVPGRININQASGTILAGIPGMTQEIVDQILSQRSLDTTNDQPAHKYECWLLAENVVTLDQMRQLLPFVTGGGNVYRAQVVGYFQGGQAASRAEVVFEATSPLPRLLLWRDISHLGRGYTLETLGTDFSK
jgi:hypothetical protein